MDKLSYELGVEGSRIRDLHDYGCQRAAQVGWENIFDFTIGNPYNPTPDEIVNEAIRLLQLPDRLATHGYTTAVGDWEARCAIAADLNARFGANATANQLFLTCGAAPAMTAALKALVCPGDEVVLIAPFFPEYTPYILSVGGVQKVVAADIPDFQIRLDKLEETITEKTAVVVLNSPNNPSGTVYSKETLQAVATLLARKSKEYGHPIYILSDEPYRELVYDGVEVPYVPAIYPNTLVLYSYSKSLSLPGERLGYVFVPETVTDYKTVYAAICGAARGLGHICAPVLWQQVIRCAAHLRPDMTQYDENRKILTQGLREAGYQVAEPQGAFYLFVRAPGDDAERFCQKAAQKDLLVVPGDSFGCKEYFRLCYCVSREKIERSLPVFRCLMTEHQLT